MSELEKISNQDLLSSISKKNPEFYLDFKSLNSCLNKGDLNINDANLFFLKSFLFEFRNILPSFSSEEIKLIRDIVYEVYFKIGTDTNNSNILKHAKALPKDLENIYLYLSSIYTFLAVEFNSSVGKNSTKFLELKLAQRKELKVLLSL